MSNSIKRTLLATCITSLQLLPSLSVAQSSMTIFEDVRIFDGITLTAKMNVAVEGNKITQISSQPISPTADAVHIAGNGQTLMPGLIDAHWHTFMVRPSMVQASTAPLSFITLLADAEAESTLLRGFTSVRDLGGPAFGLKLAIDNGVIKGPRIWPSGAMISQTGGHGDFRMLSEIPSTPDQLSYPERIGISAIADSADEVRKRTREQLLQGASQIKLTGGGGVSSPYGPLDTVQLSINEIHAAVEAAASWGTYVTVHAYTPEAVRNAIKAGAKVIDHGQLADDETAKLMADTGTWWSLQPFLADENANQLPDAAGQARAAQVFAGTDNAYRLAKKYGVKVAFGTDILFDANLAARQGSQLSTMTQWYTPAEVLKMATADNAELLALSDRRNPYPGKLGVVEVGALADLLLVNGNPLADIGLLADPEKNLTIIMKDGQMVKNKLMSVQNSSGQINDREQTQVRETVDRFLQWEKTVKPRGVYREDLGGVLPTLISSEFLCLLEMASDVRERATQEDPDLKPPFVEGSLFMPNAWDPVKGSTIISSQHILGTKESDVRVSFDYGDGIAFISTYRVSHHDKSARIVDIEAGGTCDFCQSGSLRASLYESLSTYDVDIAHCKTLAR